MKNVILSLTALLFSFQAVAQEAPTENKTEFDATSLQQEMVDLEGNKTTVGKIFSDLKGKIIFLDLWASWCPDCIKGLPKLEEVQNQYPDLVYLFLSLDRKEDAWKKSIEKYNIKGEHYWFNTEWKNAFTEYIGINWIPRYMLIDREGNIAHYYAIHADDVTMMESLVELLQEPAEN
jgi:thiol-disulfide isomerase/thioredoxin